MNSRAKLSGSALEPFTDAERAALRRQAQDRILIHYHKQATLHMQVRLSDPLAEEVKAAFRDLLFGVDPRTTVAPTSVTKAPVAKGAAATPTGVKKRKAKKRW